LGARDASAVSRLKALFHDYKQLSKFRLSALVVSTAAAGYAAGSKEGINWQGMGWTCLGTMLASSSANALNQAYERVNDGQMRRTLNRPLPAGRMSRAHALAFAAITGAGGVWLLLEKTNETTAALGAANIALYAAVYTPLKQLSVLNTWVGAVVGAVPPLMGWAAASGGLDVGAAILASGLYFWQMPHFMALAWLCRADYAAGGYKMLSLIDPTGKRTAACALRNCMYLLPLGALATYLGVTTPYFAYESAFITGGMLLTAAKFYSSPSQRNARLLFRASLLHLPIFMIAFLLHRRPNIGEDRIELFAHNARLLGLGSEAAVGVYQQEFFKAKNIDEKQQKMSGSPDDDGGGGRYRVQLPPMPFLLPAPQFSVACPSKALCSSEKQKHGKEERQDALLLESNGDSEK
jgi:protoheme IX farnesyltransferase